MNSEKPREIAARVLQRTLSGSDYVENLLEKELARARLSSADRGLCQEMVYGAVRWERALDELIRLKTGGRTQKGGLQALLRLGLYQIFWLDRVPNHAAVHETVEAAKRLGFGSQSGFVNAVLRSFIREEETTRQWMHELKRTAPAVGYSHPDWLWERWQARWGAQQAIQLMEWNNSPPPTFARVNTLRTNAEDLAARWSGEGVKFLPRSWPWLNDGLVFELESHPPLAQLPSFKEGLFYIQDPSTLLAVEELDPRPDERILDLCSAPGGKATFMAQRMRNQGTVVAEDIHTERLDLLRENCLRLGTDCVRPTTPNLPAESGNAGYDRILIDAPCSNTGVLRRRVELRWRIRPEEIRRLARIQLDLLERAAPGLKPGGVLVYSTCSIEPEENREVVDQFLARHPEFTLSNQRELLPFIDNVDGAWTGRLRRKSEIR